MSTLIGARRSSDRTPAGAPTATTTGAPAGTPQAGGGVPWAAPRVNLLPPEVAGRRAVRAVQRRTGLAAVGVVVLIGAVWGVGHAQAAAQAERLDAANAQVAALQAQQLKYAEAPQTEKRVQAAEVARATAMAQDVRWYAFVDSLTRAMPATTWLVSVDTTLSDGASAATATTAAAAAAGPAPVGQVTISARTTSYDDVAAYLDALAAVPGVSGAFLTTSSLDVGQSPAVVTFAVTATVTDTALTHRFDQKAS
ncbi:PilN domain-containing protein [Quadrisphaera oryzae]|uniref:PilN domain-containing protein n=1 Tax=Quadrisphaera TaxID=317661 RepID=UPI001644F08A|nr:PilN domain-containing protein [Quadrisphaera sp. RL12-1S]